MRHAMPEDDLPDTARAQAATGLVQVPEVTDATSPVAQHFRSRTSNNLHSVVTTAIGDD